MRNVTRSVLPMLLVVLAMTSPVGADMTVYVAGYAVEVPSAIQLLVAGFALLGVGRLVRKRKSWSSQARE